MTAHRDQTVDRDVVEFARLGSVKQVSMGFTVPVRNWPTFQAVMDALNRGNGFDPKRIAATFRPLFDDAANVEFGHEGSEVLYVTVPYTTQQRLGSAGGTSVRLSDEERQEYTRRVIAWARDMDADEISVQQHPHTREPVWNTPGDNPYKVRIWWD